MYALQQDNGKYFLIKQLLTDELFIKHLEGEITLAIYPLVNSNETYLMVLDLDSREPEFRLKILTACREAGLNNNQFHLEFSGNKGYHFWFFFEKPVLASKARQFGRVIINLANIKDKVEIFPKQDSVKEDKPGNGIKLPLGVHRKSGDKTYFIDKSNFNEISPEEMTIKKIAPEQLGEIISRFPEEAKEKTSVTNQINSNALPCFVKMMEGVKGGCRNVTCFTLACHLKRTGLPQEIINTVLVNWNLKNTPPMEESEITTSINSAFSDDYGLGCGDDIIRQNFCNEATCSLAKNRKVAEPAEKLQDRVISVSDFLSETPEEISYFIDPILPTQSVLIIGGQAKDHKTMLALNMALSLAAGKSFLNHLVSAPVKVLFVQQEISRPNLYRRFKKMTSWSDNRPNNLLIMEISKGNLKLDSQEGLDRLGDVIKDCQPQVVVIDPLYKFHNGEENSAKEMTRLMDSLDRLRREYQVSFIIVHHLGKPIKGEYGNSPHKLRGSSVLFGYGDSYLTLDYAKKHGKEYRFLKYELRNDEAPSDLIIKFNPETLCFEAICSDGKQKVGCSGIYAFIQGKGGEASFQDILNEFSQASENTIRNRLKELEKQKQIIGIPKGRNKYYKIGGNSKYPQAQNISSEVNVDDVFEPIEYKEK